MLSKRLEALWSSASHKAKDFTPFIDEDYRRRRLKGARGRGTLENEKPPIFGMIQRGGAVVVRMLENVQ